MRTDGVLCCQKSNRSDGVVDSTDETARGDDLTKVAIRGKFFRRRDDSKMSE